MRRALLEADVSLPVVKDFVADVREKAVGAEVVRGVSPDQKFIQVVHEQLVEVMGAVTLLWPRRSSSHRRVDGRPSGCR